MRKVWANTLVKAPEGQILVDFYPFSPLLAVYGYFSNIIAQKYQAKIISYKYNKNTNKSFLLKFLYKSFNTKGFVNESPGAWRGNSGAIVAAKDMVATLSSKGGIKKLSYREIPIGESVYLTYLRRAKASTVLIDDKRLCNIVAEAIHLVDFWLSYHRTNVVYALIASHDAYIEYYIPMAVARSMKRKVYLLKDETVEFKAWDGIDSRFAYLPYMQQVFSSLGKKEKDEAYEWSQKRLKKRLAGKNADLFYAKKDISAFSGSPDKCPKEHPSGSVKVLIATSSPYDNPLVYGDFLFEDFNEWLTFLGNLSRKTNYSWFLKMHPWADEFYQAEVRRIMADFSNITILPIAKSFNDIAEMGVKHVLTSYGTVGHELPLLGFNVINAGNNPHVSYDFNVSPGSVAEYEQVILGLPSLNLSFDVRSIYSFYYMQYNFIRNDKLVFGSSRTMSESLSWEERFSESFFDWYRQNYSEETHQYSIDIIREFVDSDSSYIFRDKPVSLEEIQNCT